MEAGANMSIRMTKKSKCDPARNYIFQTQPVNRQLFDMNSDPLNSTFNLGSYSAGTALVFFYDTKQSDYCKDSYTNVNYTTYGWAISDTGVDSWTLNLEDCAACGGPFFQDASFTLYGVLLPTPTPIPTPTPVCSCTAWSNQGCDTWCQGANCSANLLCQTRTCSPPLGCLTEQRCVSSASCPVPTPTPIPTNTPKPPTNTPIPPTNTPKPPTATPTQVPYCRWCGDTWPCSSGRNCDSSPGICIVPLNRNQGDCDCDANCSGSLVCVEAGTTDRCCYYGESYSDGCYYPCPGGDAGDSFGSPTSVSTPYNACEYICPPGDEDWYSFTVTSGQLINLDLTSLPASTDYELYLYRPNQTVAASSTRGAGLSEAIDFTADATGNWRARIYGYNNAWNSSDSFCLAIEVTTPSCAGCWQGTTCLAGTTNTACGMNGVICVDCTASGQICLNRQCVSLSPTPTTTITPTPVTPFCRWTCDTWPCSSSLTCDCGPNADCSGGSCIILDRNQGDCDGDCNCRGSLVCYQRDGTDYCCNVGEIWDGSCTTPITPIPTPTPTVNPACPAGDVGDSFDAAAVVSAPASYNEYICAIGDEDWYRFSVIGTDINVSLTSLPADYDLYLYRPDGSLADQSENSGTADESISFTADMSGDWRVMILGYNGAWDPSDSYSLLITLINEPTATATPVETCQWTQGETWDTHIMLGDDPQVHSFSPPSGTVGDTEEVEIRTYWQWSGSYNQNQHNEDHRVTTPFGISQCRDLGDEELEGQSLVCSPGPGTLSGNWTQADGDLEVTVAFAGDDSSPGSHYSRVSIWWCVTPPPPTAVPTPTPVICEAPVISSNYICPDETETGFRFTNVTIPSGAQINQANLRLYTRDFHGDVSLLVSAEDVDNAENFLTDPVSNRLGTTAQVNWSLTPAVGWNQSPNLASLIQEIIDRDNWQAGYSLNLLLHNTGSNGAWAVNAYDNLPSEAATLIVTYTLPPDPIIYSFDGQIAASADDSCSGAGEIHPSWSAGWPLVPLGGPSVTINWLWDEIEDPFGGTMQYQFQLARDADFNEIIFDSGWQVELLEVTTPGLEDERVYYARVRSDGECLPSSWTNTSRIPNCTDEDPFCAEPPPPRDPPDAWCQGGSVCIRWGWLPVEGANEYRVKIFDENLWEILDTDWNGAATFPRVDSYLTYTTCGLDSDEIYSSQIGARGFCSFERWSGLTPYSHHCEPGLSSSWFQTQGGDVHSQGSVDSNIPGATAEPYFSVDGSAGYPGLVSYHGDEASFGSGDVSTTGWLAQDSFAILYNFDYFYRRFDSPEDNLNELSVSLDDLINAQVGEDLIVVYPGASQDLTITGGEVTGGQQLVILVDGQLTITGDMTATSADKSFLGIFTSGDILVEGQVTNLEGLYFSDSRIDSCSYAPCNQQLEVNGAMVADEFILSRNLADNTEPAEVFRYRPDLVLNAPLLMWRSPQSWQELAP